MAQLKEFVEHCPLGLPSDQGELLKLAVRCSHETIRAVLCRHSVPSAPLRARTTSWRQFFR